MKLVNRTGNLWKRYGIQKAVDLLIDAGFDALDFTFPDEGYELLPTDKDYYTELRKYVESKVCPSSSLMHRHHPAMQMRQKLKRCLM